MASSGYSGTPLAKKLGIKAGFVIRLFNPPDYYGDLFDAMPHDVTTVEDPKVKKNLIHYFTVSAATLESAIIDLRNEIRQDGMIWISWPKKSAKTETDLDGNIVREIALRNGLVDVKVCSVDDTWSGLKLMIRIKDREQEPRS